jgi:RHS repeat-associated protein
MYALDMTTQNDTLLSATSSGNTTFYLSAQGRPLAELTATWAYYLSDATQTPRQLVDATGNVTLVRTYTPWGEVLSQSGTGNFTWGYFGGLMDAATGLLYVGGGQYYDPATGRFLTKLANGDATNPYVPRSGDPLGAVLAPFALLMLARKRKGGKYDRLILVLVLVAAAGGALAACGTPSPAPTNTSQPTTQPPPTKTPKPTDTPIPTPTSIYQNCRYPYENGKFNEGAFRACRADSLRLTNALSSAGFQYEPRETWSGNDQEKYFNWNAQSPCSTSGPSSLSDQCIFFQKPDNLVAVVLHHTGSEIEVPIQNLEAGTDGVDVAFHFLVKKSGTVVEGRPMLVRGTAAPGGNIGSVSIEIEGNFHENKNVPRREQIQATIALINAIKPGTRLQYFSTHRDIYQSWVNYDPESLPAQQSTDCPGQFFYTALTQGPLLDEFEKMTGLEYRPSPFTWGVKIPGVATSTPTP